MPSFMSLILATALAFSGAFTVAPAFSRSIILAPSTTTRVWAAGPEPEEEEGMDLDLGEMFDMFDAADKEEDFDEALKKVKGDDSS